MLLLRAFWLALLSSAAIASGTGTADEYYDAINLDLDAGTADGGGCDDSFPLVAAEEEEVTNTHKEDSNKNRALQTITSPTQTQQQRRRRLVINPWDETQTTFAPLCPDGRHVDIRHLQSCQGGNQCFVEQYQSCLHITSQECRLQFASQGKEERDGNTNNGNSNSMGWNNGNNGWDSNNNWNNNGWENNNNNWNNNNMATRHDDHSSNDEHHEEERKCPGGQCWSELYYSCFHVLSQECRNPPTGRPTRLETRAPTMKPVFDIETRDYPVSLKIEGVKNDYEMTQEVRAMVVRYASEVIEAYLEEPLELIEVVFVHFVEQRDIRELLRSSLTFSSSSREGTQHNNMRSRRLEELVIPLRITVKGPTNVNEFALLYVIEILKDYVQELIGELKNYDYDAFKNADISTETYDPSEVTDETAQPSKRPTKFPTQRPTRRPSTPNPTPKPTHRMMESIHPVKLIFKNVPKGYVISLLDRTSIIQYVTILLEENLDERLEVMEVTYPESFLRQKRGGSGDYYHHRHLDGAPKNDYGRQLSTTTQELPLLITVNGPRDISDFALVYIMEVFDSNMESITNFLKTKVDFEVYVNVDPSAETYDLASLGEEETDVPTEVPTVAPSVKIVVTAAPTVGMEESVHPIRLVFENVPSGFQFTPKARAMVIQKIKEILKEGLKPPLSLSSITYAGRRRKLLRSLQSSPSLPLLIAVEGPPDAAEFAPEYIMEVIEDEMDDLEDFIKSVDDRVEDPEISVESFDPNEPPPAPVKWEVNTEEEETPWWIQPWWVWFLVALGLLALLGCICFFCGCLCRYQKYKYSYENEKDVVKETAIVEAPQPQPPVIVEKPLIVEKPVIVEREIVLHRRPSKKHKKHKKKKKRKQARTPQLLEIEAPKMLQIEQPPIYEHPQIEEEESPFIAIDHNHISTRSGLTFEIDPPSENYTQIEGGHPFHGRLLAPSVAEESRLQLMPPPSDNEEEQSYMKICADPSQNTDGYSYATREDSRLQILQEGGHENQSQRFGMDPSERHGDEPSQKTYYNESPSDEASFDPSGAAFDAAFDALANWKFGDNPEDEGMSRPSRSNRYYSKEPSGYEFSVASQRQQLQQQQQDEAASYMSGASTHTPSVAPAGSYASRASSIRTSRASQKKSHSSRQPSVATVDRSNRSHQQQQHHPASFFTQPPTQQQSSAARQLGKSIFAGFDDPDFAMEEDGAVFYGTNNPPKTSKVPKRKSRRQSGGISSDSDSEIMLSYHHPGSTTF